MTNSRLIAGADEAGRGAWAGPLVAAALLLPPGKRIRGVKDSKRLSPQQRETLFPKILKHAISCVVVSLNVTEVDQLGVHQANLFALSHCITHLDPQPDLVLVDGFRLDHFSVHKGYGTTIHQAQLKRFGVSPWHRRSFAPIAELLYTK